MRKRVGKKENKKRQPLQITQGNTNNASRTIEDQKISQLNPSKGASSTRIHGKRESIENKLLAAYLTIERNAPNNDVVDQYNGNKRQCRRDDKLSHSRWQSSPLSALFVHGNEGVNQAVDSAVRSFDAVSTRQDDRNSAHHYSPSARRPSSVCSRASQNYFVPDKIPPPLDEENLACLWKLIRETTMEQTSRTMSSAECRRNIFGHRSIRVRESISDETDMWSKLQKTFFQLGFGNYLEGIQNSAGLNVYLEPFTEEKLMSLERQLEYVRTQRCNTEAEWSSLIWQNFFFTAIIAPDWNRPIKNGNATMRFLEDRTQRVIFRKDREEVDSRYPPIISHFSRPSVVFSDIPWQYFRGKKGGSSGYAYCDISYRVSIQHWVSTLSTKDQLRLETLPLMRLYSSITFLPSLLLCEVKASCDSIDLAINYLALQAATMQHERLKLCWLGRSTDKKGRRHEYMKKPSYFVVHLLALVGHEAHHYICRLRPTAVAKDIEILITYEIVSQRIYDLRGEYGGKNLCETLNKIHAMNNTIGHDAQVAELKAALNSECMDIPHQGQTFAWKCEANEPVLVVQSVQPRRDDLEELPDRVEQAPEADVVTPSSASGLDVGEAEGTMDTKASTGGQAPLPIRKAVPPPSSAESPLHKNRSGLARK